jgi:hypothetical protein
MSDLASDTQVRDPHVARTFSMIEKVSPHVARDMRGGFEVSLVDYARRFYQARSAPCGTLMTRYRAVFATRLSRRMAELEPGGPALDVAHTLAAFPVIQTAPHCQLYVDPMAFWAYLLGWIGASEAGCPLLPVFNTATVTLQSRASSGPAWLTTSRGASNITTSPSSRLAGTSVCAAGRAVAYDRAKIAAAWQRAGDDERPGIAKLERSIVDADSLADSTDRTNTALLRGLSGARIVPVLFSESLVADLMADLLVGEDPLICAMLFDPGRQARLRLGFERATSRLYGHFLSTPTAHFWATRERKIRRLELQDGWLVEVCADAAEGVRVRYERAAIADALRAGVLVPNLFWSFALVAILPGLTAIGGTRQIGYLEGFVDILCQALDPCDADEAELHEGLRTTRSCFWGAKVIESMPSPLAVLSRLSAGSELDELARQCRSITLREATRDLEVFRDHQRWRHVSP